MKKRKWDFKKFWSNIKGRLLLAMFLLLLAVAVYLFGDYIDNHSDALMVIITAVYVIATFEICRANQQSAEATKQQLDELKKQYDADNRPYIETELFFGQRKWLILRFVNNGRHTAQHVKIDLSQDFINSLPEKDFRSLLEKQKSKECIIGVGQHYDLFIGSADICGAKGVLPLSGTVSYQSEGKTYSSDLNIDIMNYVTFISLASENEELRKCLTDGINELNMIRLAIEALNKSRNEDE